MHHNYHVFEPGAPAACSGQRFRPTVPRKYCVIQGLPGSGKSTLANAIGNPYFPYFATLTRSKPTVVLAGTEVAPNGAKPQRTQLSCSLFSSANGGAGTLSRSLSDLEVRHHVTTRASGSGGADTTVCGPDISCVNPSVVLSIELEPTSLAAAHNPSIDRALQSVLSPEQTSLPLQRTAPEVSFVFMEESTTAADDADCRKAALPSAGTKGKRSMLGIVESQHIDERPAMHLVHTVAFVMSADEAFSNLRSSAATAGHLWADRYAAVVSSMSAVTTCDGDRCRCCLVVNLDHFVLIGTSADSGASSCSAKPDDWEDVGAMETGWPSSSTSQSAVFDGSGDLEEARRTLARKWRLLPSTVFLFSCRRVLADRSIGNVASPMFASESDANEFAKFLAFVESNHARGESEWAASHPPTIPAASEKGKRVRFSIERESEAYVPPQEAPSVVASFITERAQREEQADLAVLEQQRSRSEEVLAILREARLRENEAAMRVSARSNSVVA